MTRLRLSLLPIVGILVAPAPASADLILLGTALTTGSGLGSVATVLTLQTTGQATTASGFVTCDGASGDGVCTLTEAGDINAAQTQLATFASIALTQASDFRLIFNANENDSSITINSLTVHFYTADGVQYASATLPGAPLNLTGTFNGTGEQGQVFRLTDAKAAEVQSLFALSNIIGISASIGSAGQGPDSFNLAFVGTTTPVPEPASMLLFGTGLAGLAAVRKRRRRL